MDSSECGYSHQLLADNMFTYTFQDDFFWLILFLWSGRLLWGNPAPNTTLLSAL